MIAFHQPDNSANKNFNKSFYTDEIWKAHFHKGLEFITVLKGCVHCTINGESRILSKNECGLCLPYEIHEYRPAENSRYWVCVFSGDYVNAFRREIRGKTGSFEFECDKSVYELIENQLINDNGMPSFYMLKACLYAICGQYSASAETKDINNKRFSSAARIIDFISNNYKKDIKLSDISELLGYDYHYVSRLFKSIFNMSFKDVLNTYRMEAALALLEEDTELKILDIAYESGFQSLRNFNDCFMKRFNTTPSNFKKGR